uniref:tRNA-intron lyase n=1 Tax=Strongyloides papillosus TaxID=174720 RepID=A0A0N5BRZ4_STREA
MSYKKRSFNPRFRQWKFKPTMLCSGYLSENGVIIKDSYAIDHLTFNGSYGKFIGQRMNFQTLSCFSNEESLLEYNNIVNNCQNLYLSFVEAFYLAYSLELLTIYCSEKDKLTIDQFWKICVDFNDKFLVDYAVYKFFKDRYWVVRSGLNFGCKYILYKNSPEVCHGNAAVYIMSKCYFDESDFDTIASRAQQRLLSNVKKDLIYCYIKFIKDEFNVYEKESLEFIKVTMKGKKARNADRPVKK